MKYRFLYTFVIMLMLFNFTVNAAGYEYTISPDKDFIVAKNGDDLTGVSKKLNMTEDELNTYFKQNGIIYLAVSSDVKTQLKISAFNDNFSSEVTDISYLDETGMSEFVDAISDDADSRAQIVENGGRKFLMVKDTLTDIGGVYTVTQYITICDNKTFYFAGYNPGEDTSDKVDAAFKSFDLQKVSKQSEDLVQQKLKFDRQHIFINCGIALFGAVAIVSIIGIIRYYIKTDKESTENED